MSYLVVLWTWITESSPDHCPKWAKYLNKNFLRIIQLFCVRRSSSQLQIFALNWAKYLNRSLLWVISLSCVSRPSDQVHILPSNEQNIWVESWYKSFHSPVFCRSCNQLQILAPKCAKYFNRILLWVIPMSCDRGSSNQVQMISSKWAKYSNRVLLWFIHLSCDRGSWIQVQTFPPKRGKYFNRIFVIIIHLSWVCRSTN
jgi:hypothetical protein